MLVGARGTSLLGNMLGHNGDIRTENGVHRLGQDF